MSPCKELAMRHVVTLPCCPVLVACTQPALACIDRFSAELAAAKELQTAVMWSPAWLCPPPASPCLLLEAAWQPHTAGINRRGVICRHGTPSQHLLLCMKHCSCMQLGRPHGRGKQHEHFCLGCCCWPSCSLPAARHRYLLEQVVLLLQLRGPLPDLVRHQNCGSYSSSCRGAQSQELLSIPSRHDGLLQLQSSGLCAPAIELGAMYSYGMKCSV